MESREFTDEEKLQCMAILTDRWNKTEERDCIQKMNIKKLEEIKYEIKSELLVQYIILIIFFL